MKTLPKAKGKTRQGGTVQNGKWGCSKYFSYEKLLKSLMGGFLICLILMTDTLTGKASSLIQCPDVDDGIPKEVKNICVEVGQEFSIEPELLEAIAFHESKFVEDAKNKNYYGLAQINVKIHAKRIEKYDYTAKDMLTAKANLEVAADYLSELFQNYGDDTPIVLLVYSGSSKRIGDYKEYGHVTPAVRNILAKYDEYIELHKK